MSESNTNSRQSEARNYSFLAMILIIGVPVLLYLIATSESSEMSEAFKQGGALNVADLANGAALFMTRIGAMVLGALGAFVAIFGSPPKSAPNWMVRK